ncbi:HGGxSTG domain-containing protein [Sodalis ligni]|uniref:HGGxSTG domain-containing protein n=1 Tax=Sodalis ligni TaxID=2697027 RepID=UPI0023DF9FFA|nr:HGGxSTG domain-containing protein [Sodalis ligni]
MAYDRRVKALLREWEHTGFDYRFTPDLEPFPDDLLGLTCGATTRSGRPCRLTDLYNGGRCKFHGGKSTGARTPEGKARQLEGYRRWLERKRQATFENGTQSGA